MSDVSSSAPSIISRAASVNFRCWGMRRKSPDSRWRRARMSHIQGPRSKAPAMSLAQPAPDQDRLSRRAAIADALRRIVGRGQPDRQPRGSETVRVRRPDRLSPAADAGGAAPDPRAGRRRAALLRGARRSGGAARFGHLPLRRRVAAGGRRPAGHVQVQPDPVDRLREPAGGGRAGGDQSGHHPGGRGARPLLRARPVEPDRLLHRRQCGGEFRRRALPEVRPDRQQCARGGDDPDSPARRVRLGGGAWTAPATTCSA